MIIMMIKLCGLFFLLIKRVLFIIHGGMFNSMQCVVNLITMGLGKFISIVLVVAVSLIGLFHWI